MPPALISVDWGTTSLRLYLVAADGSVLDRCESADGILSIGGGRFAETLAAATGPWRREHSGLPVLMSGMIGSRQGWREAPYAGCPVRLDGLAGQLIELAAPGLASVHLVPGVSVRDGSGRPDVIRGEETQVLGALELTGSRDGLFVLPGTHSKWVVVADGAITSFRTYMTGEVFAALKDHTILGRLMAPEPGGGQGFPRGVAAGAEPGPPGALLNRIFSARTLGLFAELPAIEIADYLSGLLIGAELAAEATAGGRPITVIASAALAGRYLAAARQLGLDARAAPADCVVGGHLALARAARLVQG